MNERELFDALAKDCPNELAKHDATVRADAIDELADYVLNQFAPLFTKEELIKQFKEQLKEKKNE